MAPSSSVVLSELPAARKQGRRGGSSCAVHVRGVPLHMIGIRSSSCNSATITYLCLFSGLLESIRRKLQQHHPQTDNFDKRNGRITPSRAIRQHPSGTADFRPFPHPTSPPHLSSSGWKGQCLRQARGPQLWSCLWRQQDQEARVSDTPSLLSHQETH